MSSTKYPVGALVHFVDAGIDGRVDSHTLDGNAALIIWANQSYNVDGDPNGRRHTFQWLDANCKLKKPAYHRVFALPELADVNQDYRRRFDPANKEPDKDPTFRLLKAAEDDAAMQKLTIDEYLGTAEGRGSGMSIIDWYGNGADMPADREGLVAMLHPQYHKRGWGGIIETVYEMARELDRWIWLCECDGSRWIAVMVGGPPGDVDSDDDREWGHHVRPGDQYIAVVSPDGEMKILGVS